jgi:CrcB protein
MTIVAIAFGGALGASLRYGASRLVINLGGEGFVATGIVNVLGAGVLGFLAGWWAAHEGVNNPVRLGVTTGLLGGFTTFSTWAVESADLWEQGRNLVAFANMAIPTVVGLLAVFGGLALGRAAR